MSSRTADSDTDFFGWYHMYLFIGKGYFQLRSSRNSGVTVTQTPGKCVYCGSVLVWGLVGSTFALSSAVIVDKGDGQHFPLTYETLYTCMYNFQQNIRPSGYFVLIRFSPVLCFTCFVICIPSIPDHHPTSSNDRDRKFTMSYDLS